LIHVALEIVDKKAETTKTLLNQVVTENSQNGFHVALRIQFYRLPKEVLENRCPLRSDDDGDM
jgi:hypothetical protein